MGEHEVLIDNNQENHVEDTHSTSECGDQNGNLNGIDLKIPSMKPPDIDYLTQLLRDRKQLAAFSNIFSHVERLLDDEINRVRVTLFQCKFAHEPLQLPEPVGEQVLRQEKIFVPVKAHPDFNFVGRILGPRGMTAKQLESETGCKIMVRGKGSIRDKKKEDMNRGKANWEHLQEELHVLIQSEDTPNRNEIKIKRAIEEVNKLLVPSPEGEDELKKKQLMELAIINGTFRNGTPTTSASAQSPASAAALGQFAAVAVASNGSNQPALLSFDQRMLTQPNINLSLAGLGGSVIPNNGSLQPPALAGASLIMQQSNLPSQLAVRCNKTENNQSVIIGSSSSVTPHVVNGITAAQLAAIAQSQAAALQLQQLQSGANIINSSMVTGIPGFSHNFPQLANVSTQSTVPSVNCLNTADVVTSQQQLNYQHQLLQKYVTTADSALLTMQLAQLQQQQQQQQLTNLMNASAINAGNLTTTAAFTASGNDQLTALAAAYSTEPLTSISSSPYNNSGGVTYNNDSRLRRFIGQSRDHPYNKRDST